MTGREDGTARAWGWVAHLREGGTTPWAQWRTPGAPTARVLPGAQQLELLRRVNLAAPTRAVGGRVPEVLVERVLTATAPGRGLVDLELDGAAQDPRFGAPAVDPAALADEELLRSAAHLLAQDVVALGRLPRPQPRSRFWRRRVTVVGDPWLRSESIRTLTDAGRAPLRHPVRGGRVVVVGAPMPRMLADAWTNACFDRPVVGWPDWLELWHRRRGLPPGLDLAATVAWAREKVDADGYRGRVELVLDERELPRALGVRRLAPVRRPGRTAAGVARRVAASLSLMLPAAEHRPLLREGLLPRLPDDCFDVDLPLVPAEHQAWVAERADRVAGRLRAAGYAVGPRQWSESGHEAPSETHQVTSGASGVLELTIRLLLGGWAGPDDGAEA